MVSGPPHMVGRIIYIKSLVRNLESSIFLSDKVHRIREQTEIIGIVQSLLCYSEGMPVCRVKKENETWAEDLN